VKVTLLNKPDIDFIDCSIGQCYDKGPHTHYNKKLSRINRVANVSKHSSVLEFTDAIFEIEASTKVLLEMTRHRQASYACKSSRYTLNKSDLVFETTGDASIDKILEDLRIDTLLQISAGKTNDTVSLMLPQAYQYRWTAKFNYRSLQNFLELRLDKHAHFQIREVAQAMLAALPLEHQQILLKELANGTNEKP